MITVIIPFHNAEHTLARAVTSIQEQSFQEWELLLIDNNSQDQGPEIARLFCQEDERIRVAHESSQGVAFAANAGIGIAKYDLIARLDADDEALPSRLEEQYLFMKEHPEVDVLATQVEFISELDHHAGYRSYVDWQNKLMGHDQIMRKRFVDAPIVQPTTMIRRSAFERFGYYSTDNVPEDFELWLRWAHHGARFAKLSQVLHRWYDGSERLSRTHPAFSSEAFDRVKTFWLSEFLKRDHPGAPFIALGTSKTCQERALRLQSHGIALKAFCDVNGKPVPDHDFILPAELVQHPEAFIVSFISQRGTGDRIAAFLRSLKLKEGHSFLLAA